MPYLQIHDIAHSIRWYRRYFLVRNAKIVGVRKLIALHVDINLQNQKNYQKQTNLQKTILK